MTESAPVSQSPDIFESGILLLESDLDVPGSCFGILAGEGYRVIRARDTSDASSILKQGRDIALVIIDSISDGAPIAKELRRAAAGCSWIEYLVISRSDSSSAAPIYLSEEQAARRVGVRDRAEFLSSISEAYNLSRMQRFLTVEAQFLETALQEFRVRTDEAASQLLMRARRRLRPLDTGSSSGANAAAVLDSEEMGRLVKAERARAQLREKTFSALALGNAGWMLVLTLAKANSAGVELTVKSAAYGAGIPLSSALRKINELCEKGFLIRRQDSADSRRSFVILSSQLETLLVEYLSALKRIGER